MNSSLTALLSGEVSLNEIKGEGPTLDLTPEAMNDYIERCGHLARKVFKLMEENEPWAADLDWQLVEEIAEMGRAIKQDDLTTLASDPPPELAKILGNVRTSRCMLFLDQIIESAPLTTETRLLNRLEEVSRTDPEAKQGFEVLTARLRFLHRRQMLQRIYSPKRANRIIDALSSVVLTTNRGAT